MAIDWDAKRLLAIEGQLLDAIRKLQEAHLIVNHMKSQLPTQLEEDECEE
jgi:hypothetical protein